MDLKRRLCLSALLFVLGSYAATANAQWTTDGKPLNMNVQTLNVPVPENCGQECSAYLSINETYVMVDFKLKVELTLEHSSTTVIMDRGHTENPRGEHFPAIHKFTIPTEPEADRYRLRAETHPEMVIASLQTECMSCATMVVVSEANQRIDDSKYLLVGLDDYGNTQVVDLASYSVKPEDTPPVLTSNPQPEKQDPVGCENPSTQTTTEFNYLDSDSNYHTGGTTCTYCGPHLVSCDIWETRTPFQNTSNVKPHKNENDQLISFYVDST